MHNHILYKVVLLQRQGEDMALTPETTLHRGRGQRFREYNVTSLQYLFRVLLL